MKIIADTPTLFSPEEGEKYGIKIIPSCTIIDGEVYKDYVDIGNEAFIERIENGSVPTTSQPAIGDILETFEENDEEILFLPIGDGLSGTYQNAVGAKNCVDKNENIHILDTKTLGGPQRYLVKKALELKEKGFSMEKIKEELLRRIETSVSFVIPKDFEFLKRSGRLTPIAAKIATMIKIVPVLTQTEDKKRITLFTVKRSRRKALDALIEHLKELGVNEDYVVSVSHAGVWEEAEEVLLKLKEHFVGAAMEIFHLSPSLITHGGPGCVLIQAIHK